jgi:hypothetical protein
MKTTMLFADVLIGSIPSPPPPLPCQREMAIIALLADMGREWTDPVNECQKNFVFTILFHGFVSWETFLIDSETLNWSTNSVLCTVLSLRVWVPKPVENKAKLIQN